MYFKRPSFKRGGSTGIAQMTPSRQRYAGGGNIGGGIMMGSNLGTRTGFKSPILNQYGQPFLNSSGNTAANLAKASRYGFLPKGGVGPNPLYGPVLPRGALSLGKAATAGGVAATVLPLAATVGGLGYMNKAKTLEGLNYMKSMNNSGVFDETDPTGFDEYTETLKKIDKEGKTKIGFLDNFLMDEKGRYPKFIGRTEDRDARRKDEVLEELYDEDRGFLPTPRFDSDQTVNIDFDDIVEKVVPNKKDTNEDKPEPTFEDTYQTEFDRIQKLIGNDDTKGMAAIALSEAIGTPGTIADKAAVLNKSLVALMGNKKKDKKEIAMLAYKATKEIEKAKIVAGKQTDSAKNFEELKTLNRIIRDDTGTYNEDQKKDAQSKLKVIEAAISSLNPAKAQKNLDPAKAVVTIEEFNKSAKKLAKMDKTDPDYARSLEEYKAFIELLNNYPELMTSVRRIDASTIGALGKKDGGRIGFANGSPIEQITETETIETSATPTAQVTQLSFEELRSRLPQEITDDVVKFLSTSNEALQDFAYIRTAGDVKKFNMKYGLNLVLPAQA
jgi:hypothetical protein